MDSRKKIIIILSIPIIILSLWLYSLINIISGGKNKNLKAEITKTNTQKKIVNNFEKKENTLGKNKLDSKEIDKIKVIKVYVPSRFNLIGRKKIKKNLISQRVYVKLISYPYNIKKIIKDLALKKIDVAIINTDDNSRVNSLAYQIKLGKKLDVIMNFLFYDYISGNNVKFIPYCIDPFVSLIRKDIDISNTNPKNITKYFLKNENKIGPITVNFGISPLITRLFLEKNSYPTELYKYNLFNFLLITNISKDTNFLKSIINRTDSKYLKFFDTKKLLKYKIILNKKNQICKYNLDLCLLEHKIPRISFVPLSLVNLLKSNDYKLKLFPTNNSQIYPVLGWNLIINKKSQNIISSLKFINEYIKEGTNYNYQLRNNCLSAFNNIYEKQKDNPKYEKIIKFEENFFILTNTSDKLEKLFTNTKILKVFKNKYSLEGFFDNFDIGQYLY